MKLICLNAWGGKHSESFIKFIKEEASKTDIFCFQEVTYASESRALSREFVSDLYNRIEKALPDFRGFFTAQFEGHDYTKPVDFPLSWGEAIFIKNTTHVNSHGDIFIYGEKNKIIKKKDGWWDMPEVMQYVNISYKNQQFVICNLHGIPTWPKTDTPERIKQSEIILNFLSALPDTKKIVCGDFNLSPETESVRMLEASMKNLGKEYAVEKTRSLLYKGEDKISDYIFISGNVAVKDLRVADVAVSDHLPLIFEFE